MSAIVSKPPAGSELVLEERRATRPFQRYLDDITTKLNQFLLGSQVQLTSYTVATLPAATVSGGMIYVSDETGGAVPAFSDGANWRRFTDRAVVA